MRVCECVEESHDQVAGQQANLLAGNHLQTKCLCCLNCYLTCKEN